MADTVSITSSKVLSLKEPGSVKCGGRDITKKVRTTSSFDLPGLLGEDDEHSSLLIEDPLELLVQNHLTQLLLHLHTTSVLNNVDRVQVHFETMLTSSYRKRFDNGKLQYLGLGETNLTGDIVDLNLAVGLDDSGKIKL